MHTVYKCKTTHYQFFKKKKLFPSEVSCNGTFERMTEPIDIIHDILIVIIVGTILLALIYSIPIVSIDRFRNFNNFFTVNLCLSTISCNVYWLIHYLLLKFHPQYLSVKPACYLLNYFETMCTLQVPLAFLAVSVHRLCAIIYHTKPFFRRIQWLVLCTIVQWTSGILLSLPTIPFQGEVKTIFSSKGHS